MKVGAFNAGEYYAEHFTRGRADFSREVEGPRAGAFVLYRCREEYLERRVFEMRLEIITLFEIDQRPLCRARREIAGEVHHVAVEVDNGGDADLRHAALADFQHLMNFTRAEQFAQFIRSAGFRLGDDFVNRLQREVCGNHGLMRMRGECGRLRCGDGFPGFNMAIAIAGHLKKRHGDDEQTGNHAQAGDEVGRRNPLFESSLHSPDSHSFHPCTRAQRDRISSLDRPVGFARPLPLVQARHYHFKVSINVKLG